MLKVHIKSWNLLDLLTVNDMLSSNDYPVLKLSNKMTAYEKRML